MTPPPIDPVTPARENPRSSMEPPYSDENPNLEAVREGLGVAEDEARNDVEETYETSADAEDVEDAGFFDDEDEATGEETPYAPELAAIHEGTLRSSIGDFESEDSGEQPDEQVEKAEEYNEDDDT